jgi:hypothetical protein
MTKEENTWLVISYLSIWTMKKLKKQSGSKIKLRKMEVESELSGCLLHPRYLRASAIGSTGNIGGIRLSGVKSLAGGYALTAISPDPGGII